FHAPAGAFWSRVLDPRLRHAESSLLGWTLLSPTGWLLFAVGLAAMVVFVRVADRHTRVVRAVLASGLTACALMQLVAMQYDFKQELNGTTSVPGGIAGSPGHADRPTFLDAAMPSGASAMIIPAAAGGAEVAEMWAKKINAVLATPWNGA